MVRVVIILSRRCIIEVVMICVKVGVLDWGILMRWTSIIYWVVI